MITISWASGVGGDWTNASLWNGSVVPDAAGTTAAIGQPGSYAVTIAAGETETVDNVLLASAPASLVVGGSLILTGTATGSAILGNGTVVTTASGAIGGSGELTMASLTNTGTLIADAGAYRNLDVFATLTNTGTLLANNGNLLIAAPMTNLSGSTLTGGTYIATGLLPQNATSVAVNILAFGFNYTAVLAVDAATIILDGPASLIDGYANGTQVPLEDQLRTIAAAGTLALLDGRDFAATQSLTDAGLLTLGGGTLSMPALSVAAGGTVAGYGSLAGPVSNAGTIVANGGTLGSLILQDPLSGSGSLTVAGGSTLLLHGGSAGDANVGGMLYDTGTLTIAGTAASNGTLVVESGGALELGGSTTPSIDFAGSTISVTIDRPSLFHGTLVGFGLGDTLTLDGLLGTSAQIVNADTLAIVSGGTTLDTIALAGTYTNAVFTAATQGNNTVVTNVSGAPARDGMPITLVNVTDNVGLSGSLIAAIENEVTYAAENWGQYITGVAPLRVSLTFASSGNFGSEIAAGGPGNYIANGQTLNGSPIYVPDSLITLQTGNYAAGTTADVAITLIASPANLANLYINPNPASGTSVPLGKIDLLSVLTHEFAHGLGIDGLINRIAPASGSSPIQAGAAATTFDSLIQQTTAAGTVTATFDGANAEAAYGAAINAGSAVPVPLWLSGTNLATESFYHLNSTVAPLATDLMVPQLAEGTSIPISNIDLAMLKDIGVPVTASVPCFLRGTRIQTARGAVAVEDLTLADTAITAQGERRPIVWIGRRRVNCRLHPRPERIWPIRFSANAFAAGIPERDLYLSPDHAIYRAGVLIPAHCLCNDMTVMQETMDSVDYFHVELATHDVLLAEGMAVESYLECGDRQTFDNGGPAILAIAEFAADRWESAGYAPLVVRGPEVEAARGELRARAGLPECVPQTDDPTIAGESWPMPEKKLKAAS